MATVVAGKYQLLEVLHESGIRTWRARQVTLGHVVMVHFIPSSQRGDDFALLDRLAHLPESARKQFFDAGEHDSVPYVVSWLLPEFDSLPSWLDRTIEKNRKQPRPAASVKTQSGDSSEFTRMFFKGMKEPAAGGADDLVAGQNPAPPRPREIAPDAAGDLFPGQFSAPPKPRETAPDGAGNLVTGQSPAPHQVKEPPLPPKEPGEFTRFFEVPAQVRTPASAPPPPPPTRQPEPPQPLGGGPGEFTQFFRQAAPAEPHATKPAGAELFPAAPLFPPSDRPAARALETHVAPPTPSEPPPKPLASVPNPIPPPVDIPPLPKPPTASVPPEPVVADDYAKVIARPPAPPPLPVPPTSPVAPRRPAVALPPLPQAQKPPSSAYLPMWIALGVLLVLAIALTLVLALTR